MKQYFVAILCLSLLFIFNACGNDQSDYFPLTAGRTWHYHGEMMTHDGLDRQQYFLKNIGETEVNGVPAHIQYSFDGTMLYYQNSDDNGIIYLGKVDMDEQGMAFQAGNQILLPARLETGQVWQQIASTYLLKKTGPPQKTEFRIDVSFPVDVTLESVNDTVEVPAGRFSNCLKIRLTGSTIRDVGNYVGLTRIGIMQNSWYARGIGLVKLERTETTQRKALERGHLLMQLVSFTPD